MDMEELSNLKEQIRLSNPLEEVIGELMELDKHHKALCPFHTEKTPSFSVNVKEGYCYCFGCGFGGDVFAFVMRHREVNFYEAFRFLAERARITIPTRREDFEEEQKRQDIYGALSEAANLYHQNLPSNVRDYLKGRGLTNEMVDKYKIGFCNEGTQFTADKETLFKAGLIYENEEECFRGYIIFPHFYHGRVVYMSGRGWPEKKHKKLEKDKVPLVHLYNEEAVREKEVIVCEGEIDTLTLLQNGFNACGVLGASSFKEEWVEKFKHCQTVYLSFDGDEAGTKANCKIAELFGPKARLVSLPEGQDVNDFFKERTKEDYQKLLDESLTLIEFKINQIPVDTPKTKLPALMDNVLRLLADMDKAKAEPYLAYVIKPRFGLKDPDIRGYRDLINKYRGQMVKDSKKDDAKEIVLTADHEGLIDIVEDEGKPAFLLKTDEGVMVTSEIDEDTVTYVPPPREQLPWLLCHAQEVVRIYEEEKNSPTEEVNRNLFEALVDYHKSISQLPDEGHYDLMAAWDMHTYLLEQFQYSPIICLYAVPERGKSRTGKSLVYVAYRGIHVESLRDAYLVRVANNLKATLFFDVMNIWQKAEKNQSEDILLHRFEKGAQVPRVLYPEKGAHRDITYYSIFGPTIIGTNEAIHRILETRAVNINMPETSRTFENSVTPELALPLKCRLLAFRARHLNDMLPDMLKPAAGRLGDILKPLLQIIRFVRPEREDDFMALVSGFETDRLIEKADSLEAQILNALMSLKDQVAHGILPVKAITDRFNEGKHEKIKVTYQRIGRRLTAMGFKKARGDNGAAVVLWDDDMLARLMERYGLKETSEISESPETSTNQAGVTDVSDETDIFSDTHKD